MKNGLLITSLLFAAGFAHAGYECQSYPKGSTLKVQEQVYPTRTGTDTEIFLQEGTKEIYLPGNIQSEGGSLYGKEVIYIYPKYKGNTLTIVSRPQSCGRGFCDPDYNKSITAKLKLGNVETNFYCHEKQN